MPALRFNRQASEEGTAEGIVLSCRCDVGTRSHIYLEAALHNKSLTHPFRGPSIPRNGKRLRGATYIGGERRVH